MYMYMQILKYVHVNCLKAEKRAIVHDFPEVTSGPLLLLQPRYWLFVIGQNGISVTTMIEDGSGGHQH